jgi:SAM-dependent methyltransferase
LWNRKSDLCLPNHANIASVTGIDVSEPLLSFARAKNRDNRITFEAGDARALPYHDGAFDRAFSMLVLHFIPEATRAVAEMRRVVRPGGWVTAAIWDNYGGQLFTRILWDIAGVLDPDVERPYFRPLNGPGELAAAWREVGLTDISETDLLIRMEYANFEDYWKSFTSGDGAHGAYVVGLPEDRRETLKQHVRRAWLGNRADGPRSMTAVAWACRGRVPE